MKNFAKPRRQFLSDLGTGCASLALGATQAEVLTVPDLASVLAFGGFVLVVGIIGQLFATWQKLGRLWSVELAGETPRPSLRRSP